MCGIAGIISKEKRDEKQLQSWLNGMNTLQAHRGPDGKGIWTNENSAVGLAHRRLSIIDLSPEAAQPMLSESGLTTPIMVKFITILSFVLKSGKMNSVQPPIRKSY